MRAIRVIALAAVLSAAVSIETTQAINFQPNYCGDPCTKEGAEVGCIDTFSQPWRRVICTCSQGWLVC